MIYFSFAEISIAALSFIFLGIKFAFLKRFLRILSSYFGYIIKCVPLIFNKIAYTRKSLSDKSFFSAEKKVPDKIMQNIYDFAFAILFSSAFILNSYVFVDGYIRIYFIALSFLSFYLCYRVSAVADVLFHKTFVSVIKYLILLLCLLAGPFKILLLFFKMPFKILNSTKLSKKNQNET